MDYLMKEFHKMKAQPTDQNKFNKSTLTDVNTVI